LKCEKTTATTTTKYNAKSIVKQANIRMATERMRMNEKSILQQYTKEKI
jgi:hypothetical protein